MKKATWPFPQLRSDVLLALGLMLIALCLYPFWGAIATAAVFAFGLKRPMEKARERMHFNRRIAVGFALLAMFFLILLPVTFLGVRLYQIVAGDKNNGVSGAFSSTTIEQASSAYLNLERKLAEFGADWNIYKSTANARQDIEDAIASAGKASFAYLSNLLLSIPDFVGTLVVFCLFLYLFLSKGSQFGDALIRTGMMSAADVQRLSAVLERSCYNSIVSNVIVGAVQASVITAGARIFGYSESVVIFTIVFFMSFIPFIGASPVAFLLALIALIAGHTAPAIGMTVVVLIAAMIDNIIRPYLISGRADEVHPVLSFAVILGAIAMLGLKGLFLGPVILTATFALLLHRKDA